MTLTEQARNLYKAIQSKRNLYVRWRENDNALGRFDSALDHQRAIAKVDRVADKALTRWFRREDKGL